HFVSLYNRDDSLVPDVADDRPGPAAVAQAQEETRKLECIRVAVLSDAPSAAARAFVMRMDEGMTYGDIARQQGVPLGTVATRIHSIKMDMRKTLLKSGGRRAV